MQDTKVVKMSAKDKALKRRQTEGDTAKQMPWDNIYSEIAKRKTEIQVLNLDINQLHDKRESIQDEINKYQRVASLKRKQQGA